MQSSSPFTPLNIHCWASRSSDLISTVSTPRPSNHSCVCSRRPITLRSRCRTQCMTILTMAFGSEIATVFVA
nr:hypothetical protein CFP56_53475 [Quercus suber]